jgi:hypothetical protein
MVQDRHTRDLMAVQGVVAVGTGLDDHGKAAIRVHGNQDGPGRCPRWSRASGDREGERKIYAMKGGGG